MVNGKRFSKSTGETDRVKAEQWLESMLKAERLKAKLDKAQALSDKLFESEKRMLDSAMQIKVTAADVTVGTSKKQMQQVVDLVKSCNEHVSSLEGVKKRIDDEIKAQQESQEKCLTIDEGWEAYVKTPKRKRVTATTLYHLEKRWIRLVDWLRSNHPEVVEIRNITPKIALEFAAVIREEFCPATYNIQIASYQQIWTRLADEIRATVNPWTRDNLPRLDTPDSERRDLSDEELKIIFEAARREIPPLEGLFTIMLYTGARLGDAATLEWRSIDLARGFIDIMPIKTKRFKTRVRIPILPPLRAMLEAYPPAARTGYVMPDIAKKYIEKQPSLSKKVVDFFKKCGLETCKKTDVGNRRHSVLGAHSFRHTFVSKAANAGIPFAIVQGIVGHSTAKQSAHYFHENDDATLRAFRAFPTAAVPAIGQGETIDAEAVVVEDSADRLAALDAALAAIKANGDKAEIAKALERVRALAD
jgi:integrase